MNTRLTNYTARYVQHVSLTRESETGGDVRDTHVHRASTVKLLSVSRSMHDAVIGTEMTHPQYTHIQFSFSIFNISESINMHVTLLQREIVHGIIVTSWEGTGKAQSLNFPLPQQLPNFRTKNTTQATTVETTKTATKSEIVLFYPRQMDGPQKVGIQAPEWL